MAAAEDGAAGARLLSYWPVAGADARSLGLFRICLGCLCVYDLLQRAARTPIQWYLSDDGMLTRETILEVHGSYTNPDLHGSAHSRVSLYMMTGSTPLIIALYLAHIATAASFAVGFRLRFSSVALWIFDMSLFFRAPTLNHSGDMLKRQVLFWAMFCPLDALSLDQGTRIAPRPPTKPPLPPAADSARRNRNLREGFGILALVTQIFLVYFVNGVFKDGDDWRRDYTATYFALSADWARRPGFGDWLYAQYDLMKAMTSGVFVLELYGSLLLFVPIQAVRLLIAVSLVLLQAGLFVMMQHLNVFPLISMTMALSLLPSWLWDRLLLLPRWRSRQWESSSRSKQGAGKEPKPRGGDGVETIAMTMPASTTSPSAAAVKRRKPRRQQIPQQQRQAQPAAEPKAKTSAALQPRSKRPPSTGAGSFIAGAFGAAALLYVVVYNMTTLEWAPEHWLDSELIPLVSPNAIGRSLGLDQRWDQYSPIPMRKFRYYAITGLLANGTSVDCVAMLASRFKGDPQPAWTAHQFAMRESAQSVWGLYNDIRMFYFLLYSDVALQSTGNPIQLRRALSWICKRWNTLRRGTKQTLAKISLVGFSMEALAEYGHIGAVPSDEKLFGTQCVRMGDGELG